MNLKHLCKLWRKHDSNNPLPDELVKAMDDLFDEVMAPDNFETNVCALPVNTIYCNHDGIMIRKLKDRKGDVEIHAIPLCSRCLQPFNGFKCEFCRV